MHWKRAATEDFFDVVTKSKISKSVVFACHILRGSSGGGTVMVCMRFARKYCTVSALSP